LVCAPLGLCDLGIDDGGRFASGVVAVFKPACDDPAVFAGRVAGDLGLVGFDGGFGAESRAGSAGAGFVAALPATGLTLLALLWVAHVVHGLLELLLGLAHLMELILHLRQLVERLLGVLLALTLPLALPLLELIGHLL